jgi:hypothetical protein
MGERHRETRQTPSEDYTMPVVVRARSFYLYGRNSVRYVDFFQNYGRAILGHRVEDVQRSIKSTIGRGLIAEYPSIYPGRLEKLLNTLFPGFPTVRIYCDPRKLEEVKQLVGGTCVYDPAVSTDGESQLVSYWRPFLGFEGAESVLLLPLLPFPGSFVPQVVCLRAEVDDRRLPASDPTSPLLLDLLVKTTAALIRALADEEVVARRMNNPLRGIIATRGPYGLTGLSPERYMKFADEALQTGVVLPPTADVPIITPGSYTEGDIKAFVHLATQWSDAT